MVKNVDQCFVHNPKTFSSKEGKKPEIFTCNEPTSSLLQTAHNRWPINGLPKTCQRPAISMTTASIDLCLYDPQETNYAKYYRLRRQKENERHQSRSEKLRENPCGQKAPIQQIDYCCSNNRSHRFTCVFQIFILKRENLTLNVDNKETTAVMSSWCHHDVFVFYCFSAHHFSFLIIFQWKKKQFCSQRSLSLFTQLCLWFCFSFRTQHVSGSSVDPSTCLIFESEM